MPKNRQVCTRGKIWELHIHSNQCFSADSELKKLTIPEYVTELLSVLDDYDDLEMISFTDHNKINFDIYWEFDSRNSKYVLLPGIEIDVCLVPNGEKKDSKHVIAYFDAIGDMDKLAHLAACINTFMEEKKVGVQKGEKPIYIHELLDKLLSLNVQFVLSPHALKQPKRDFDADWHGMEEAEQRGEMKKYLDQFFCFWEASGSKQIHHATDFLKDMDCGERMSIIAFSDSKDFKKLKRYLDHPCQYFNALPNFNGLKMAGSEITRITREQYAVDDADLGSYIGQIEFDGQLIELTPRLNAIIGGRGSGKSVLLDSIANHLGLSDGQLDKDRLEFIQAFPVVVTSMSGISIDPSQFNFDYYNQSYISKLFQKHGEDFNRELESYFRSAFEHVEQIDVEAIRREKSDAFAELFTSQQASKSDNLVGFVEKYAIDRKDALDIAIPSKGKKVVKKLVDFNYEKTLTDLDGAIKKKIPAFLSEDEEVKEAVRNLKQVVCSRAYEERMAYLTDEHLFNIIVDAFRRKKTEISRAQKDRSDAIGLFQAKFENKTLGYRQRVALVNAIIKVSASFQTHYEKPYTANGEKEKAFQFKRELDVEHPIDFMIRLFAEQMLSDKKVGQCRRENLWTYILRFCFGGDCYKQNYSADTLYKALSEFKLEYEERSAIYFRNDSGSYVDISKLSPGTQTNILIEYIVHQDTGIPLLIDQPEDNVDNQTIFEKIRDWFMSLKTSRQVIVVTHDANIVINADADNIILAKQRSNGDFQYDWGALEYGDMLDNASLILDGGKEAVKRRLVKYGE